MYPAKITYPRHAALPSIEGVMAFMHACALYLNILTTNDQAPLICKTEPSERNDYNNDTMLCIFSYFFHSILLQLCFVQCTVSIITMTYLNYLFIQIIVQLYHIHRTSLDFLLLRSIMFRPPNRKFRIHLFSQQLYFCLPASQPFNRKQLTYIHMYVITQVYVFENPYILCQSLL